MSSLEVPFCVWTTSNLAVGISLRSQGIVAVVIFVARMGSTVAATTMCGTAMFARHYRRRHNKRRGKNEGNEYALHGLTRENPILAPFPLSKDGLVISIMGIDGKIVGVLRLMFTALPNDQ